MQNNILMLNKILSVFKTNSKEKFDVWKDMSRVQKISNSLETRMNETEATFISPSLWSDAIKILSFYAMHFL